MIFSRRRGNAGRNTTDPVRASRGSGPDDNQKSDSQRSAAVDRPEFGPYDLSQAPEDEQERLDLGALRIPAVAGVEIHLQAGSQGEIQQVQLAYGASRLQLGAFAAPRTDGIWSDIRETLRASLAQGGAKPVEVEGDYGVELRATVRDGASTTEVRHVGIDGPRWFVHGVFLGAAAGDPGRAGPLLDVLRGLIVDRGNEARPISEALPLRLPPDAAAQLAAASAGDHSGESQAT